MADLYNRLVQYYHQEMMPVADPRTKDWFLLQQTPVPVWLITIAYLVFVWLGPKYMRNRQPFDLKIFMVVYNIGLVFLSTYLFVEILVSAYRSNYDWICAPYNEKTKADPLEMRMANVLYWYFFSKVIELMDTVLMILRKKNDQVSFLHVFHHATMMNIWWWVMMFIPGGLSYFGSALNSLVHVVMYSYYGLSAIPALKGKLWWKKYITRWQLLQFCTTLTHTLNSIRLKCDFPRWGQNLLAGYMIFMLILFSNFYIHAYIIRSKRQRDKAKGDMKKSK